MTHASVIQSVSRFLRLEPAAAANLASGVMAAYTEFERTVRQRARFRRGPQYEMLSSLPPATDGPVVIALAFARRPLLWLQRLSLAGTRSLCVLRTGLSAPYLRDYALWHGPLELLTPLEMIRHQADSGIGTVFVTFPDHAVGSGNTNVLAPLFGESLLFQTLESLLARKHGAGLYRFDVERLERWVPGSVPADSAEECLTAEAAWLAVGIERMIALAPVEYFGWDQIARKCPRRQQRMHRMRLEVLKGFLRSWALQAQAHVEDLDDILAMIDRDGSALIEAQASTGLRLAVG